MNLREIIAEIDAYSRRTGLKHSTICQHALGNALFYERINRRADQLDDQVERLRAYMASNPPAQTEGDAA